MDAFSNMLSVRALNHWRNYSIPTYLGLRSLLKQVPQSGRSEFLTEYLLDKVPLRPSGRYRVFPRYKGMLADGTAEYRQMYAASPSTALAEAYALHILSGLKTLGNRPYVFSNTWPGSRKAGSIFSYFYSGYAKRNALVTGIARKNKHLVVVSNDIRSFYPSINRASVRERLGKHLQQIKVDRQRQFVSLVCEQLLNCGDHGIAIGPALSHVFANLPLEQVDREMHVLLRDRYLRYVDDILMVVTSKELPHVQKKLESLLENEGLTLNVNKHDELTSLEWLEARQTPEERHVTELFERLQDEIRVFLWDQPTKMSELSQRFRENGIPMLIKRYATDATYGRYHRYFQYRANASLAYKKMIFGIRNQTTKTLYSRVLHLRNQLEEMASKIEVSRKDHDLGRKIRVQRLRYFVNRLLYLTPLQDYAKVRDLVPDIAEFDECRSVVNALLGGSVDALVRVPGPAVSTFASISDELGLKKVNIDRETLESRQIFDSLATLTAFGVFEPPEDWVGQLAVNDKEYTILACSRGWDNGR